MKFVSTLSAIFFLIFFPVDQSYSEDKFDQAIDRADQVLNEINRDLQKVDPGKQLAVAKTSLTTLSTAAEVFAQDHSGRYPLNANDLTDATPPYLTTMNCDKTVYGFTYSCYFEEKGYKFVATPAGANQNSLPIFLITTGGVLSSSHDDAPMGEPDPSLPVTSSHPPQDQYVIKNLRELSAASEMYATNNGKYPSSWKDLAYAKPPYIDQIFCGQRISGYAYECQFSPEKYIFTAIPVEAGGEIGTTTYTITVGGVLTP